MKTRIVEVTNGFNWGKFLVGQFDAEEWHRHSSLPWFKDVKSPSGEFPLLLLRGWGQDALLVLDVETGEGAVFVPGGLAAADLRAHQILVCPLFEPFLEWLYAQVPNVGCPLQLDGLPDVVELPDAPKAFAGYRRPGPGAR